MKALDTNVIVRYLVQDDRTQGQKAATLIEGAEARREQLLIGNVVLCELVWVLDSAYSYSRAEIVEVVDKILQTGAFTIEAKDTVWRALEEYRTSRADFADCLIGHVHRALGSETTVTFDNSLRKLETFELL